MNKKGFTLVELIVVMVILSIILTGVYRFFFNQEKFLRRQREWSEMNIVPRKADGYISRELRNIGFCDRVGSGGIAQSFGIINGGATSIAYSHDMYGVQLGVVDHPADTHSIRLRGDTLLIDGDFALDNVVSLSFTYIDTTGDTVTDVNEVSADGIWQLLDGYHPVEHIEYSIQVTSPFLMDTVNYRGLVSLRNKRP
jgi:prepilin-type N-terminal cleavage/methylation domain-containing protein